MNGRTEAALHRLAPVAVLFLVTGFLSFLVPTSEALWFKVLGISGRITTREAEGCTPGFWKQEQHFNSWTAPYSPSSSFEDVFGRDVPDDPNLLEALELKGGGLNALMRHAVAALLNAAHPDIDYAFSVEEVISKFQAAFDSGEFEATKDEFEAASEAFCPIDGGEESVEELTVPDMETPTPTTTPSLEIEVTATPTHTPTDTATNTASPTPTPEATLTPTPTSAPTDTSTPEIAPTLTPTDTPTSTPEEEPSPTPTSGPPPMTDTPVSPTDTPTPEPSPSPTPLPPAEPTASPTPES